MPGWPKKRPGKPAAVWKRLTKRQRNQIRERLRNNPNEKLSAIAAKYKITYNAVYYHYQHRDTVL